MVIVQETLEELEDDLALARVEPALLVDPHLQLLYTLLPDLPTAALGTPGYIVYILQEREAFIGEGGAIWGSFNHPNL